MLVTPTSSPKMTRMLGLFAAAGFCCACAVPAQAKASAAINNTILFFMVMTPLLFESENVSGLSCSSRCPAASRSCPSRLHQRDDHRSPQREQHVADGVGDPVAERRNLALRDLLHRGERRRRGGGAAAHTEQYARMHLEEIAADEKRHDQGHD